VSETPVVVYLEADDEVTSVVRRLRAADAGPIVVVAPGRSRATSSVVALRLLGRAAEADGRSLAVVGDALTRSLAAEAGVAAFATLDDARAAEGVAPPPAEPRHAAISVVRGPVADETAPTMAALAPSGMSPDDVTRPVAAPRAAPRKPARTPARAARRRSGWPFGVLGALALLLVAATVAAASLLPAATVTIVPRTEEIGPVAYAIEVADADSSSGTETATAEVVATGTYEAHEPAGGTVVLFNWTYVAVDVPAGTFVAAGEQAFATQADVTVPPGSLTAGGQIAAGDVAVAVVAAAPGPAGNVAAEAIDTVVNQSIDARLRGFPNNPERRVVNPEPTTGGTDATGPEILQADVNAAVAELRRALASQVAAAIGDADPEMITVEPPLAEPAIDVPDGLVGTRDQERVEISGELAWEVVRADPAAVSAEARDRFLADPSLVSAGQQLLEDSLEVELGQPSLADGTLTVPAAVTARSAAALDVAEVRERIAGRSAPEAEAALADLGSVSVDLWPGWVSTVPELEWRVEVLISEAGEGE
jgi:hypothetical protein